MRHDAAGTNHGAIADRDAGADNRSAADPAVGTDGDGARMFAARAALEVMEWMMRGVDLYGGADECVVADADPAAVKEGATGIDVDIVAEADAVAVVAMEGRTDDGCRGDAGDELFEQLAEAVAVSRHGTHAGQQLLSVPEAGLQLGRLEVGRLAAAHFLDLGAMHGLFDF